MASAKHLNLMMTADSKDAETKLSGIEKSLQRVQAATSGFRVAAGAIVGGADPFQTLKGMGENLLGSIPMVGPALQGSVQLLDGFLAKIREVDQQILSVGKSARSVGANIEGYSGLLYAAGGDAATLDHSLFHLSESIGNAAMEGGDSAALFQRLGLDLKSLSTMKTDEQFLKVAGALSQVNNSAERNADAMKILGKGAVEVMGLVNKGEEGIRKVMDRGKSQGRVVTAEDVAVIKQQEEAIKQLDSGWESLWRTVALKVSPSMQSIAGDLGNVGKPGAEGMSDAIERGSTLLQLKYMFQDLFSGDFGPGASAQTRAEMELANQANLRKQAIEDEKKRQADIDETAKKVKAQHDVERKLADVHEIILRANPWGKMQGEIDKVNAAWKTGQLAVTDYQKALDAVRESASKPFIDKAMGPFDKLQKDIANLKDAKNHLGFGDDVFKGNLAAIIDQYKDFAPKELKSPGLIEQGSASEASLIVAQQRERDAKQIDIQSQMKSLLDSIKQKQEETAENTKNMARALENLGLVN